MAVSEAREGMAVSMVREDKPVSEAHEGMAAWEVSEQEDSRNGEEACVRSSAQAS